MKEKKIILCVFCFEREEGKKNIKEKKGRKGKKNKGKTKIREKNKNKIESRFIFWIWKCSS